MIIGLAGYAQAGKDTVGGILVDEHGFKRLAFADALKNVAYESHPQVRALVDRVGWESAKADIYSGARAFLQDLGVACRHHIDENVWVEAALHKMGVGAGYQTNVKWVITDVRFPNEAGSIQLNGGRVVRVHRPGTKAVNAHISESALDSWEYDGHLYNDDTVNMLRARVGDLVQRLRISKKVA